MSSETLEIRVEAGKSISLLPNTALSRVQNLYLYIRGERLDGALIGSIVSHCQKLQNLTICRKDNDWDAPNTLLSWHPVDDEHLASSLRHHATHLEKLFITGILRSCPLSEISQALVTVPNLTTVKLQAEHEHSVLQSSSFSPKALRQLLQKDTLVRLSLLGIFPETEEYKQVLHQAFVHGCCKVHIFLSFATETNRRPGRFSFYIREIMELNQNGRAEIGVSPNKLVKVLRQHAVNTRRSSSGSSTRGGGGGGSSSTRGRGGRGGNACPSLDGMYLLIRENPWICERKDASMAGNKIKTSHRQRNGLWSRIRNRGVKQH